MKFTPAGGTIGVRARHADDEVRVTVWDTGVGIAADDLERIFERFYRVPARRRVDQDPGSGIGLTISRGIARAHGGELSASSPGRGHGATFTLQLPYSAAP